MSGQRKTIQLCAIQSIGKKAMRANMDDHGDTALSEISPAQKDKKQLPSLSMYNLKKLILSK